jgi:signal transduction histidine kinase
MVIGAEILLETACSKEVLKVNADSSQLEQVVINLATNSQHAMPDGGRLSIHTETVAMDPEFINLHGFGEPGKYALITVMDTGTGMDPETLRSIFVPFFTTMIRVKNGSGLGLSIVYSIIRQHNGFIDVSSIPDKGTTFRIFLPLTGTGQGPEKITSGKKRT